jgi:hypothetical protein
MPKLNIGRVLGGGLVAGLVLFLVTGVVNGALMATDLRAWAQDMGAHLQPPPPPVQMSLWALMCAAYGIGSVWIYAAIRPCFGAGPKTALLAGGCTWCVGKGTVALDLVALGLLPGGILLGQLLGGLVGIVGGALAGAALYRDP